MRIGLVSLDYPPDAVEGVARQRHVLAHALAALGHSVHVVTKGHAPSRTCTDGVTVHRVHTDRVQSFHADLPVLDRPLTDAQLLCEGVLDVHAERGLDVVDVPLWLAQPLGLVRQQPCPVVVWLQTTLLQLVELQHRQPRPHERVLAGLDRVALDQATACIADSNSIVDEIVRLYDVPALRAKTALVYPGIEATARPPLRFDRAGVQVLVVGRLEHRKATAQLFEVLPRLLSAVPDLHVRFVGRDNSGADGFARATGKTYPQAWTATHPALAHRVSFDGYVDDATLARRYAEADLVLHPAHYESFGLVFTEAMRAGLPVIACAGGGASEVFPRGEADGAVLVPPGDMDALADAAIALGSDPRRRRDTGAAGRRAYEQRFSSERMARETVEVYTRAMAQTTKDAAPRPRIFHVMEALQERDAVSRITRTNAAVLATMGAERPVMALFAAENVRSETGRLRGLRPRAGDAALVHYWGYSRLEERLRTWPGPLAIHYHNITPPEYFAPGSAHEEMTRRGYAQLKRLADRFDLLVGDSHYNLRELAGLRTRPAPGLCLYPVIDAAALHREPFDAAQAEALAGGDGPRWLFVGRVAPNKRQDDVIRAFDRFVAKTGTGRLALVGDMTAVPDYVTQLRALAANVASGPRITFAGSVDDATLLGWYRWADVFVCASRHEGFCVPLAEAMAFDVPIVALDRGAVGETVGAAGVVLSNWDADDVADRVAHLLASPTQQEAIAREAISRLSAFSMDAAADRLSAVVRFLRDGTSSPHFVTVVSPHASTLEMDIA